MEEALRVLEDRFGDHPAVGEAIDWFQRMLDAFELLPRSDYESAEPRLADKVRDPKDLGILAAAIVARVDTLVSGDKDLLTIRVAEGVPIRRTRDILGLVERHRGAGA